MVEDIQAFDPMADIDVPRSAASIKSGLTDAIAFKEPKTIFDDDYIVLDHTKVPQNTIEQIEKKMIRINRRLKKMFSSENELQNKIKDEMKADGNGNVSVDQLRDFILNVV